VSRWGLNPAAYHQNAVNRRVIPIEQPANLLKRISFAPPLPHQRPLALRVTDTPPLFHLQHLSLLAQSLECCVDRLNPQLSEWEAASGYHRRSLAETLMYRHKALTGHSLWAREIGSQATPSGHPCGRAQPHGRARSPAIRL
jgi:hypothetical protein